MKFACDIAPEATQVACAPAKVGEICSHRYSTSYALIAENYGLSAWNILVV